MLQNKIQWLQNEVFPEAVQAQSFGADANQFVSFETNNKKASDQFCSDVVFGDVTIEKVDGELVTESVIIKLQPAMEMIRESVDCDALFHNEILFYSKLIPLFQKYDTDNVLSTSFCEFVYGKATNGLNPEEDFIILKSLHEKGFQLTDERIFIDEEHVQLALDRVAKYHALSFKCQSDDSAGFLSIVSQIKNPDNKDVFPKKFVSFCTSRGIDHVQNDPMYKDRLSDIRKHCDEADDRIKKYKKASEHLNVITHGDFNRNNMMFKYGNNGEPIEVVFFDLATIKYCSPAIDTSILLFVNTLPEVRQLYWDDFLETYYGSLSKQLEGHPVKPSLEDVELDIRRNGIYGYLVCSFFLPSMMAAKTKDDWEQSADAEHVFQIVAESGGLRATEYLAEIVKHMLDRSYIFED